MQVYSPKTLSPPLAVIGAIDSLATNRRGDGTRQRSQGENVDAGALAKRAFDVLVAGAGLALISPLLLAAAIAVRLTTGHPVLYRDRRSGRDGQPFDLLKFRTMRELRAGEKIPDDDAARLTSIGGLLRKTSIDELPALINVVRGDMSLVGPRPLPVRYLERYSAAQRRRLEATPGITGWAQINGRNLLSWEERFDLDTWYVDNRSLRLDITILVKTFAAVLRAQGVSPAEDYTMPEFGGSQS